MEIETARNRYMEVSPCYRIMLSERTEIHPAFCDVPVHSQKANVRQVKDVPHPTISKLERLSHEGLAHIQSCPELQLLTILFIHFHIFHHGYNSFKALLEHLQENTFVCTPLRTSYGRPNKVGDVRTEKRHLSL